MDVNQLVVATISGATSTVSAANGVLTISNGVCQVNNNVVLAEIVGTSGGANGTLALYGGEFKVAGDVLDGGGISTLTLAGATLDLQPTNDSAAGQIGSALNPIDNLNLNSGILKNVAQINGGGPVAKSSPGTLAIEGSVTYSGDTLISDGLLVVNGILGTGSGRIMVSGGGLGGTGLIHNPVEIQAGGTLAPGITTVVLTISNSLVLGGTAIMEISKGSTGAVHDQVAGLSAVTFGGNLIVTNTGTALAAGDRFTLFVAGGYSGAFANILLPPLGNGLRWETNQLHSTGTLSVVADTGGRPALTIQIGAGNTIELAWPEGYGGYLLQAQTNAPGTGIGTNWLNVPEVGNHGLSVPITNADVFFRLSKP